MARKTKYDFYNDSFKATAVTLAALPGTYAADVAEILDIHPVMLYRWKKEYRDGIIMNKTKKGTLDASTAKELKRLQAVEKAHETLKMQHDLLKKASSFVRIKKRNIHLFQQGLWAGFHSCIDYDNPQKGTLYQN